MRPISVDSHSALNHMFAQMGEVSGVAAPVREGEQYGWRKSVGQAGPIREELSASLTRLRDAIRHDLSERQAYQLVFPIVVFLDEIVQLKYPDAEWSLLQKELFQTDRGGALFYESLDELLREDAPELVYQAYYFCLKLGFQGRLAGEQAQLDTYLEHLKARFRLPEHGARPTPLEVGTIPPTTRRIYFYYVAAIGVSVALYFILLML